jgi:hypothetical protein
MTLGKYVAVISLVASLTLWFGCSKKESTDGSSTTSSPARELTDSELIQATLDEVVTRWRYGDKGGLYDMEWEYLQDKYTFDQYLEFGNIKPLVADTMERMVVTGGQFAPKESAIVNVDVIFKGPTGQTSIAKDTHMFFFHRGRWVRPIAGARYLQLEYEHIQKAADSAAEEEAKLEGR